MIRWLLFLLIVPFTACSQPPIEIDKPVRVAAERMGQYLSLLDGKKVGLVVNHSSLVGETHLVDTLLSRSVKVIKIFAPEHGFRGKADAGAHIDNETDSKTGLPIISLYGNHRKPTKEDLAGLDVVVFDIQDVGVRFYTYISTLSYVLEAGARYDVPVMVLDRPNPNGHYVDGPIMEAGHTSFIGLHEGVPVAHGMTVGEYAQMVNGEGWLPDNLEAELTVIPCANWTHDTPYNLPVRPSPNLPNMRSIYLYPSLCFFEATVLSVGRGTDAPFQVLGHPDYEEVLSFFAFVPESREGATDPKLKGQTCYGMDLTYLSTEDTRQIGKVNLAWLIEMYQKFPSKGEFFLSHFHKLAGNDQLQEQIEAGLSEMEIRITWREGLERFKEIRKQYLIYP